MTMPLDPTPTATPTPAPRRVALPIALTVAVSAALILADAFYRERARADDLAQGIAYRECIGRVTDLMVEANADANAPTLMASSKITTLCDSMLSWGAR